MFKKGDHVRKKTGYSFEGIVVIVEDVPGTGQRYVVRQDEIWEDQRRIVGGALHIFSEKDLEII